jgi:outer membrane protein assembly factor BamB
VGGEILWKVMVTGGDMFNDPDVYAVGGVVLAHDTYVGDLQALEARTGDIVWATRVSRGSQLELAISRDVVYLIDPAGDNQAVHAVHAATNTTRWSWLPESGPVSAVAETGGLTFIAADRIEAVGTQDGATRWSAEAAALYLATSSGVVVASDVGELTALTAGSGSHLWRRDAVDSNAPPLVQADGGLLHVHDGETLSAIRPDDGNVAWTRVLDAPSDLHRVGAGMVFVDSPDNRLRALRADTGEPVWSRENALFFGLSGGMAFVTDLDRARLHALRPADGIVLWTRDADEGDQWGSGAVTVDGVVCVSTTSGHVQAFRPPSGGVRGTL